MRNTVAIVAMLRYVYSSIWLVGLDVRFVLGFQIIFLNVARPMFEEELA